MHKTKYLNYLQVQNVISFAGVPQGVYTLDVLVSKDGRDLAYEGILVIGKVQTAAVNKAITKETTTYVFEDKPKPKPKPNICYFDPDNKACDQLPGGGCPKGSGFNDDDRCIPLGKCPSGYGRLDDDETGKCYQDRDIKTCPDGYVTHKSYKCPTEPVVCPAGQELSSDGLGCAPPCDGSYQDCIYNGYLCKAGSSEHACELPLEEEEAETEQELSCQPEDDFCEPGCESQSMDCIDDVNIGDDGEDSSDDGDDSGDSGGDDSGDSGGDDSGDSGGDDSGDSGGDAGGDGKEEVVCLDNRITMQIWIVTAGG